MTNKQPTPEVKRNNYARNLRLFVQRLIKMAREQVVMGRNYGWTHDSMAQELDFFISQELTRAKQEVVEEIEKLKREIGQNAPPAEDKDLEKYKEGYNQSLDDVIKFFIHD